MQNEEVPLIVKKNMNNTGYDKCGSCNQQIVNNSLVSPHNFYNNDYDNSIKGRSMKNLLEKQVHDKHDNRAKTPNVLTKSSVLPNVSNNIKIQNEK